MSGTQQRAVFLGIASVLLGAIFSIPVSAAAQQQAVGPCQQGYRTCVLNKSPEPLCADAWRRCMSKCTGAQYACNKEPECQAHCTERASSEIGVTSCCSPLTGPTQQASCKQYVDNKCVDTGAKPGDWQGEGDTPPAQSPQTPQTPAEPVPEVKPPTNPWDILEQPPSTGDVNTIPKDVPIEIIPVKQVPITPSNAGDYASLITDGITDPGSTPTGFPNTNQLSNPASWGQFSPTLPQYANLPIDMAQVGIVPFQEGFNAAALFSPGSFPLSGGLVPQGGFWAPIDAISSAPSFAPIQPAMSFAGMLPSWSTITGMASNAWDNVTGWFSPEPGSLAGPSTMEGFGPFPGDIPSAPPVAPALGDAAALPAPDPGVPSIMQYQSPLAFDPFPTTPTGIDVGSQLDAIGSAPIPDGIAVSPFDVGKVNQPVATDFGGPSPAVSAQLPPPELSFEGLTSNPETGRPYTVGFSSDEYGVTVTSYIPPVPQEGPQFQNGDSPSYDMFGNPYSTPQEAAVRDALLLRSAETGYVRDALDTQLRGYQAELDGVRMGDSIGASEFGWPTSLDPARQAQLEGLVAERQAQIKALDQQIAQTEKLGQYFEQSRPYSDTLAEKLLEYSGPDEFGDIDIDKARVANNAEQWLAERTATRRDLEFSDFRDISQDGTIQDIQQRAQLLDDRDVVRTITDSERQSVARQLESALSELPPESERSGYESYPHIDALRTRLEGLESRLAQIDANPDALPPDLQNEVNRWRNDGADDPAWARGLRAAQRFFEAPEGTPWYSPAKIPEYLVGFPGGVADLAGYGDPRNALMVAADPEAALTTRVLGGMNAAAGVFLSVPGQAGLKLAGNMAGDMFGSAVKSAMTPSFNPGFADNLAGAPARVASPYVADATNVFDSAIARGESFDNAYKAASDYVGSNIARNTDIPVSIRNDIGGAIHADLAARGFQPGPWIADVPTPTPRVDVPTPSGAIDSPSNLPNAIPTNPSVASRIADWWRTLPETLTPPPAAYTPNPNAGFVSRMGNAMSDAAYGLARATGLAQAASRAALISAMTVTNPIAVVDNIISAPSGIARSIIGSPAVAAPTNLVARTTPFTGTASTYNPNVPGWRTGGQQLATGGRYNPNAYEAALQLSLARQYGVGYGSRKTGYALVEAGNKQLIVKINDNGPLLGSKTTVGPRIIDLNEASMRYLSDGRLGNNSGLLQDVKVTLLQGQNYRAGPVVPDTRIADVSGQTRIVTPASRTQVADNLGTLMTDENLPMQRPAQTRTIPLGQYLVEQAVKGVRNAAENVRQTLVEGAQGNRVAQEVFEEAGARGDRLIAEKAADLRERALTRVGRGAAGSETQAPAANAARTAPTPTQHRQMAKEVIDDMGGLGGLSKYYTYDARGVLREYGSGKVLEGIRMQPVGAAAMSSRLAEGYNIVSGQLVATHHLIQRTLGVDTLTFNSGSRPTTIGSNRHHTWVKAPDGKRILVSYAVDYTGGNANIKAAIATAASRSQWALNQEIAASTGRANAIPLSVGARYAKATNMVHVDTYPHAAARSWGNAKVSNRLMQVYNTLRRPQTGGPTYVSEQLFAESLAAARMGVVPNTNVAAVTPPSSVAAQFPADFTPEMSIGRFPITSRLATEIREATGRPVDAVAIRDPEPPDPGPIDPPRIAEAPTPEVRQPIALTPEPVRAAPSLNPLSLDGIRQQWNDFLASTRTPVDDLLRISNANDAVPALSAARPVISTDMDALISQAAFARQNADTLAKLDAAGREIEELRSYAWNRENLAITALTDHYRVSSIADIPPRAPDQPQFIHHYRDVYAEGRAAEQALTIEASRNQLARMQIENIASPIAPPHSPAALAEQQARIAQQVDDFALLNASRQAEADAYFRAFADAQRYSTVDQLRRVNVHADEQLTRAYGPDWKTTDLTSPSLSPTDKQTIANALLSRRMEAEIDMGSYTFRASPAQEARSLIAHSLSAVSGTLADVARFGDSLLARLTTPYSDLPIPEPSSTATVPSTPQIPAPPRPIASSAGPPAEPPVPSRLPASSDGPTGIVTRPEDAVTVDGTVPREDGGLPTEAPRPSASGAIEQDPIDFTYDPITGTWRLADASGGSGGALTVFRPTESIGQNAWSLCASRWTLCAALGTLAGLSLYDVTVEVPRTGTGGPAEPGTTPSPGDIGQRTPGTVPSPDQKPPSDGGTGGRIPGDWRTVTPGLGNINGIGALSGLGQILQGLARMNAANQQPQPPYAPSPTPIGPTQPNPTPPTGTTTPAKPLPSISVTANPNRIEAGETSMLRWISFRSTECEIRSGGNLIARVGTQGERPTEPLSQTTAFVVSCGGEGGTRHATSTVYVGEEPPRSASSQLTTPAPAVQATASTGGASTAAPSQTSSSGTGAFCDPARPVDEFIRCLQAMPQSGNPIQ